MENDATREQLGATPLLNETYFDGKCLDRFARPRNRSIYSIDLSGNKNPIDANNLTETEFLLIVENPSANDILLTDDPLSQSLIPSCPQVQFDRSIFQSTVSTEWHLICEHEVRRPLFQNIYTVGLIVGCLFGGDIGDRLGRARAVLLGSIAHAFATIAVAFTTNFVILLLGRFVVGVTNLMILVTVVTLALETCPEKFRGPIGMGVGFPFSIGVVMFAVLGIFLRDWRHLYIATSFPALLLVPVAWFLDESPRWLLQVGKLDEATEIMNKAATINKLSLETKDKIPNILKKVMRKEAKIIENEDNEESLTLKKKLQRLTLGAFTSFKTPEMRKINIICPIVWFLNEVVYYGTIFNANTFSSSNPFLYVALTGVADGAAVFLGVIGCHFGRRLTVAGSQFTSGLLILLVLIVPDEMKWLQWIFVMVGFLMCACASQALFVYTPELYPTVIRARGFAFSNLAGYIGTFVAPFIPGVLAPYGWWITNTILGSIGFITCAMVINLPETNRLALCETIQDVEQRGIKNRQAKLDHQPDDMVIIQKQNNENESKISFNLQGIDNTAIEKEI